MLNDTPRKTVNVDKPNLVPLWNFKEGDDTVLNISLFKDCVSFDITGQTIRLGAKTDAGLKEQIEGFTIQGNNLDIALKNTILVPGIVEIDLEFTDVEGKMTSTSFFINVDSKVLNNTSVKATNEFDSLTKAVEEITTDYQGLRRIVINENNAADLQDQVNTVNTHLEDITPLSRFVNFSDAIVNGGVVQVGNKTVNADGVFTSNKPFVLQGQTPNATKLDGNYKFIIPTITQNGFRDIKLEGINNTQDVLVDFTHPSSTSAVIDNVQLYNAFLNGIRIKAGFGHIIKDSFLYGRNEQRTGTGLQLSPSNGDWNNVVNISNANLAWWGTALDIGGVVTCNIIGTHFGFSGKGILFRTTPPNPTRDVLIEGCYFEALDIGIEASPINTIEHLKIKDCFFSVKKIADLKNIYDLKFVDCSHADSGITRTSDVILEKIGNLQIENSGELNFKTSKGFPILTNGSQYYKENILTQNNKISDYNATNCTKKDVNSEGVKSVDGKVVGSMEIASGVTNAFISKRLAYGTSTGDVSSFLSSRGIGGKVALRSTERCNARISVTDGVNKIDLGIVNLTDSWTSLKGFGVTPIFPETAEVLFSISIIPFDVSKPVKVYIDSAQCWLDFLNPPEYVENIFDYPIFRRRVNLSVDSLDVAKGLFFPVNDYISKSNPIIGTVETQKGWRVQKAGYNYTNVPLWTASTTYNIGDYVKLSTNQILMCTKNGTSGSAEPTTQFGVTYKLCPKDNTTSWYILSSGIRDATFVNDMY